MRMVSRAVEQSAVLGRSISGQEICSLEAYGAINVQVQDFFVV